MTPTPPNAIETKPPKESAMLVQLKAARRVSTPLVKIDSADPAATVRAVRSIFENGAKTPLPFIQWDVMNGLAGLNKPGRDALAATIGGDAKDWPALTQNPGAALDIMAKLPGEQRDKADTVTQRGTIVFMLNAQRFFEDRAGSDNVGVIQGIWNLRDSYKQDRRMLVMLGAGGKLPPELAHDVVCFDEPLPDTDALRAVVAGCAADAGFPPLTEAQSMEAIDAVRALSEYEAEQVTAMSLTKDGLDVDALWARKISSIEQTDGLSVDRGALDFNDIGGLGRLKEFGTLLIKGNRSPLVYVMIDEMEKMLGGTGGAGGSGDNTGVSQDALGVILREMEDNDWPGLIAVGPAGTGKSLVTKSLANTATRMTGRKRLSIALDLGAARGGIVGESEKKIRGLMKALRALAGRGQICFVATCNKLDVMPPELKRRFRLGIWFFDLPTRAELVDIWAINLKQYGLDPASPRPDDTDWTGADVRNVCDIADRLGCTLTEASGYIVPVAKSDPEAIARLRGVANGKFLSANHAGKYRMAEEDAPAVQAPAKAARRARGEDN